MALDRLVMAHGRNWASDPRYRLAWYIWPLSASVVAAALLLMGLPGGAPTGNWSKPYEQSGTDMDALRNAANTDLTARDRLKRLAEAGDPAAQFSYGTLFDPLFKLTETQDISTAMDWYLRSAKQGNPNGQRNYGMHLYDGDHGVTINYDAAFPWLLKAAQQGDPLAQYYVGQAYMNGHGTKEDPKTAFQWYKNAAEKGYVPAQAAVGDAYRG